MAPSPSRLGRYVTTVAGGETVRAFVPPPLPPNPPVDVLPLLRLLSAADQALGRLDGIATLLPSHELFLYMYVRKEAVLSSQIEGTQSTLADLLQFEAAAQAGTPFDDVREVSNYVAAMQHGLARLGELPLSLCLVREMHALLLRDGRGATKDPGEFRRSQNWIGGTRPGNALFVPPPPNEVESCLGALEAFIHEDASGLPMLIKAGLLHVQFETIHPFLDGNGRIGRLLVTLYLCTQGVLRQPLLYLSLYLKAHRADYYRLLQEVREHGAWEAWLEFFLRGVSEVSREATETARRILALREGHRNAVTTRMGRAAGNGLRVLESLYQRPIVTVADVQSLTGTTYTAANNLVSSLTDLGILAEATGYKRNRVFRYQPYIDLFGENPQDEKDTAP
jgi:Fic family protein